MPFLLLFSAVLLMLPVGTGWTQPENFRAAAGAFAAEMASKHGFPAQEMNAAMGRARYRQSIIDAIRRPAESKPWYKYRRIFLTRERAEGGAVFWKANEKLLVRVAREYGVPAEIIVAIIGVETSYGRNTGKHRVLDSLSTLAFGYPKRSQFFRKELEQYLLLTQDEGFDPLEPRGSYAGAMGRPQFIPSSYRAYAIDFDHDGKRDLWDSNADVIGSVANYFKRHGWQTGQPIAYKAQVQGKVPQGFVKAGMKPSIAVQELEQAGVTSQARLSPKTRASLIQLDNAGGSEYWLGLHNFYVITRYNHSNLYAMAVYQLSEQIKSLVKPRRKDLVSP